MIKKFKTFFQKEFDYTQKYIDPYEFHKVFFFFSRAYFLLEDRSLAYNWSYYIYSFVLYNTIIVLGVSLLGVYDGVITMNVMQITETGTYIIIFAYVLLILSCQKIKSNMLNYYSLQRILKEDFEYVSTAKTSHRERFYKNQMETWKMCLQAVVFISGGCISLFLIACLLLVFHLATHEAGDGSVRPLLCLICVFDLDMNKTPFYEIAFMFTNWTILTVAYVYSFMLQTQILWVREIAAKADLIIYCIEDLMEDIQPAKNPVEKARYDMILKTRFRSIIKQHHSMIDLLQDFSGVFKKLFMFEQKLGGPVVCLTAFGVSEKLKDGKFHPVLFILCFTTVLVVFIPSYLCTFLGIKIRSICDACWETPFWDSPSFIRPYFVLIMQRCQRPLPLQAPGFEDISLQTFSSKMAGAYSMFNMLRQTNIGGGAK